MKIMIIGGAGFIGSYIAQELVREDDQVLIYDSFLQYTNPLAHNYNLALKERFKGIEDKIEVIRGNTTTKEMLREAISNFSPEVIIQLAHLPILKLAVLNTEEATTSTINGTVNILDIIRKVDCVKKFIYTSSSMVYGDFEIFPASENHPKRPKGVYGGVKLAGEEIVKMYQRRFGINYIIIRPSAVYGYTDINDRVSGLFINNAFNGKPLILDNGGNYKLDFTYVKDVAKGFVLACKSDIKNETFNLTRGESRSLMDFANILKNYFPDLQIEIKGEEDPHIPKRGALDISKARKLLGYDPKYSLEEGIKETIELIKQNKNGSTFM